MRKKVFSKEMQKLFLTSQHSLKDANKQARVSHLSSHQAPQQITQKKFSQSQKQICPEASSTLVGLLLPINNHLRSIKFIMYRVVLPYPLLRYRSISCSQIESKFEVSLFLFPLLEPFFLFLLPFRTRIRLFVEWIEALRPRLRSCLCGRVLRDFRR